MSASSLSNARDAVPGAAPGKPMERLARAGMAAPEAASTYGSALWRCCRPRATTRARPITRARCSRWPATPAARSSSGSPRSGCSHTPAAFAVAAFGSSIESEAKDRLKALGSGVVYLVLGIRAVKIASGAGAGRQAKEQQDYTASAMQHTGGRWLVAIVGIASVIAGACSSTKRSGVSSKKILISER